MIRGLRPSWWQLFSVMFLFDVQGLGQGGGRPGEICARKEDIPKCLLAAEESTGQRTGGREVANLDNWWSLKGAWHWGRRVGKVTGNINLIRVFRFGGCYKRSISTPVFEYVNKAKLQRQLLKIQQIKNLKPHKLRNKKPNNYLHLCRGMRIIELRQHALQQSKHYGVIDGMSFNWI